MGRFWLGIGGVLFILAGFGFLIGFLGMDIDLMNQEQPKFLIERDLQRWNMVISFASLFVGIVLLVIVVACDVDVKKAETKKNPLVH